MIGEPSSSQSCFSGSNALSHVYIKYPPLRCHIPGLKSIFYDDGNKLILSLTSNQVIIYRLYNAGFELFVSTKYYVACRFFHGKLLHIILMLLPHLIQ